MLRTVKYIGILIFLSINFGCSSNSSYLNDPNAQVIVTSQYESETGTFLPPVSKCQPPFDCAAQKGASCSAALYHNALKHIKLGLQYEKQKMHLSAKVEILMGECRLNEAKKVLNNAKVTNYNDWEVAVALGLEQHILNLLDFCKIKIIRLDRRSQ